MRVISSAILGSVDDFSKILPKILPKILLKILLKRHQGELKDSTEFYSLWLAMDVTNSAILKS